MIKKLFFYLVMLAFMIALLELFAFAVSKVIDTDDFFDSRQAAYARFSEESLAKFKSKGADSVLGWRSFGPRIHKEDNCLGEPVEYRYDAAGARLHDRFDRDQTEIVIVGDSYTNGDEVGDSETYPAILAQELDVSVVNHGVGGYGPTQSLLNLQKNIAKYPQARVVVLGIMYENLYRMVNSFRPVLYSGSSDYTLKPYMAAGRIVPHPGEQVFEDIGSFRRAADDSFDSDFWAKPEARFPYLIALGKSLSSNYFYYRKLQKELRKFGQPEYFLIFDDADVRMNMVALLNEYARLAKDWGVQPVAVFIPRNQLDTSSAARFIAQHRSEIDPLLVLGDVGEFVGVDWTEFNLREPEGDNICHPSPYGYRVIASYLTEIMRKNNVWPPP